MDELSSKKHSAKITPPPQAILIPDVYSTSRQSSVIQSSLVPAASTDKLLTTFVARLLPQLLFAASTLCLASSFLLHSFASVTSIFPPKAGGLQRRSCHLLLGNSLGSIFTTDSTDGWMTTCQCANVAIYVWCNSTCLPNQECVSPVRLAYTFADDYYNGG